MSGARPGSGPGPSSGPFAAAAPLCSAAPSHRPEPGPGPDPGPAPDTINAAPHLMNYPEYTHSLRMPLLLDMVSSLGRNYIHSKFRYGRY